MKSRLVLSAAILSGFVLGLATVRPMAIAMQAMGITSCSGNAACIGGQNGGSGPGTLGHSKAGYGVSGASTESDGVFGQTYSKTGYVAGVYGIDTTSGTHDYGVIGSSINGTGVSGGSSNGDGVIAGTSALKGTSAAIALSSLIGADLLVGEGAKNSMFKIDTYGNIYTQGQLYSGGTCSVGCSPVTHERSYGTTAAVPTIEDAGEGQLAGGVAVVRLDPSFANAIDQRQSYIVLLTPEGDTRGLYVTSRTPNGFVVRETMGGRSSIGFAYRIIAHPYGVREPRLPMVTMERPQLSLR